MKALIKYLRSLETSSPIRGAKTGTGVLLYQPKPFDLTKLISLAQAIGLEVIYNERPDDYNGKRQDPRIFVGKVADFTDEDIESLFASQS